MAQIRISLDQSLIDDLQAQADAAGITLSALLAEKAQFAPAAAPASTQDAFTLDQAADAFLRVLELAVSRFEAGAVMGVLECEPIRL